MLSTFKKKLGLVPLFLAGVVFGSTLTGTALAYQGHMWNALHSLQTAKAQLQAATPDKGGHRENAIGLVDQAIDQVDVGIQVGAQ
jgi:hypothetical protein